MDKLGRRKRHNKHADRQIDKCSNCMTSLIFDEIAVGISQTGKSKDIGAEIKSYHQKMRRNK